MVIVSAKPLFEFEEISFEILIAEPADSDTGQGGNDGNAEL